MGHNTSDYLAIAVARNEPEILDQNMTPGDSVAALERLKFHGDFRTIKFDGPVAIIWCPPCAGRLSSMLALSDDQLAIVMTAAGVLPPEKRSGSHDNSKLVVA